MRSIIGMKKILAWLDELAVITAQSDIIRWLDRIVFLFLVLMTFAAPHSIAATQIAWLIGMLAWVVRMFFKPRPSFPLTTVHLLLLAFFGWTVISSVSSYAPDISFDKLRGASLFLIFFFVFANLRNLRAVYFISFALILSCTVNALIMPIQRIIGRGIEIHGVSSSSPLKKAGLTDGDAILEANGKKLSSPADLIAAFEKNESARIRVYRTELYFAAEVKRVDLLGGTSEMEKLGIAEWNRSRDWRSAGFYSHYTTYAEVLQLIGSLVLGLLVAAFITQRREKENGRMSAKLTFSSFFSYFVHFVDKNSYPRITRNGSKNEETSRVFVQPLFLLLIGLAAILIALLLTVTRGPQLALLVSAFFIVLIGAGRKWVWVLAAAALPIALGGLFILQQSRQVGFFDPNDESTRFRQTVYREGLDLWTANARHFFLGVGMDSVKRYSKEWHLYDNGRYPMTHFHSTPLQLVVERGLPALLLWLAVLTVYARSLWRGLKRESEKMSRGESERFVGPEVNRDNSTYSPSHFLIFSSSALNRGILLGCLGGMIGFFVSSLVHYNLGDGEVAMVFYLLMGLGVRTANSDA